MGIEIGKSKGIIIDRKEGKVEGAYEKALETAKNFLRLGLDQKQVAQGTALPLETIEKLSQEVDATNN